jgi:Arabinose-binding domain of AraC transcription regulator, N-term
MMRANQVLKNDAAQRSMRKSKKARLNTIPTAAGGITRAAYAWALKQKLDVVPLLKQAGLTVSQINEPAGRIGVKNQIKFINLVAKALADECLGFRLAQSFDLRELGLLYYVPASSETLGLALQKVARYSSIHNEGVRITCHEGKSMSVAFEYVDVARRDDRHQIEFFVVTLLRISRQLTSRHLAPSRITFIHRRNEVPPEFKTFFGCDLAFGDTVDQASASQAHAGSRRRSISQLSFGAILRGGDCYSSRQFKRVAFQGRKRYCSTFTARPSADARNLAPAGSEPANACAPPSGRRTNVCRRSR